MIRLAELWPVHYCSDREVQQFVEDQIWNIGPYTVLEFVMTPRELFQAARDKFTDYRCLDLIIPVH